MFGWEFPPYQAGGLATATVGLVKGLLRNRVAVTLVVPFPVEQSPLEGLRLVGADEPARAELPVHRIPSPMAPDGGAAEYREVQSTIKGSGRIGRGVYGPDLFQEVARFASLAGAIAAREPHDLIDTHDWITFQAGIEARRVSGKPMVAHIHATEFDRAGDGANPDICRLEHEGMMAADRIIANSRALRRTCTARYGIPESRIDVVHWGIDGEALPADGHAEPLFRRAAAGAVSRRPPVVLFLGRVTWQKGPGYFIEVAARIATCVPEARFVVAGQGDLLPQLMHRAAELGLADRVHFAGGVHGADVHRLYRAADVSVMPSVSEPFGLVALESLRNGTPCLIPKTAGVAEVISNTFKLDFWDVDGMADRIIGLLRYPELRAELAENARREVEAPRFSLEEPARLTTASYARARALTMSTR